MKRRESVQRKRKKQTEAEFLQEEDTNLSHPSSSTLSPATKRRKKITESPPLSNTKQILSPETTRDNVIQNNKLSSPKTRKSIRKQQEQSPHSSEHSQSESSLSSTRKSTPTKEIPHNRKSLATISSSPSRKRKRNSEEFNYFQKRKSFSSQPDNNTTQSLLESEQHLTKKRRLSSPNEKIESPSNSEVVLSPTLQSKLKSQQFPVSEIKTVTSEKEILETLLELKQKKLTFSDDFEKWTVSSPVHSPVKTNVNEESEKEKQSVIKPQYKEEWKSLISQFTEPIDSDFSDKHMKSSIPISPSSVSSDSTKSSSASNRSLTTESETSHVFEPISPKRLKVIQFFCSRMKIVLIVVVLCLLVTLLAMTAIWFGPYFFEPETLKQEKHFRFLYDITINRLQEQRGAYECGEADNFYLPESEIRLFLMQYDFVNEALVNRVLSSLSKQGYNESNLYFHPLPLYSMKCLMKLWLKENWHYLTSVGIVLLLVVYIRQKLRSSREEKLLLQGLVSRIHGILKAQKKRSMTEPGVEPWIPKLHIRDQIVVNDRYRALWNKAEENILKDSRILETPKLVCGEQMDVWLWIGNL